MLWKVSFWCRYDPWSIVRPSVPEEAGAKLKGEGI